MKVIVNKPVLIDCPTCGAKSNHRCKDRRSNAEMNTTHPDRLVALRRARSHGKRV